MTKYYGVIGNRDHIKYKGEKRPFWEFLDIQPDGFLSSLAYLPVPFGLPDLPMIGDCGAWSYKNEIQPKLRKNIVTPEWTLEQYKQYFKSGDLVVAPDHMLIPGEGIDLDDRRSFNIESARSFLPIAKDAGFLPMATVHGMDMEERLINVGRLYEIGYNHFSLGGMAARASQKKIVLESIQAISDKIRSILPDAWIHVLGLSSPDYFAAFNRIGIDSCDGSSHFKQAFTAGTFFVFESERLVKYQAARPTNGELITAPSCNCLSCSKLREEGIDTRSYGSNENNMGRAAHNLNMLMQAQRHAVNQPKVSRKSKCCFALVSCVGEKLSESAPAKDLYRSAWFLKARNYVESEGYEWYVISAKYGLINRSQIIEPYNMTLNNMSAIDCQKWASMVFEQILKEFPDGGIIVFFAGERYRKYLIPLLENAGYSIEVPLQGLGIGQQLAWFNEKELDQLRLF
jgi:hypothetical protein